MNPRLWRLLVLLGLVAVTWGLLARFVWLSNDPARRDEVLPYGGVAFASYLLTVGYGVYFRSYWATPRRVTGREWSPMWRWAATIVGVGVFGVALGVAFPDATNHFAGLLLVQTVTFGGVGVGLVLTVSKRPTLRERGAEPRAFTSEPDSAGNARTTPETATPAETPPTFGKAALRTGAWQVYAFVGAALLFGPIYLVMKGFERYVDIPACVRTCEAQGYTYESLVTGKSIYDCNCRGAAGRHTYHERAHIGGGTGVPSAILDWMIRTAAVLGTLAVWVASLFAAVRWVRGRKRQ